MKKKLYLLKRYVQRYMIPWLIRPLEHSKRLLKKNRAQRRIFIDCGANTGHVLKSFIRKRQGFEFHAFEIQSELIEQLKHLQLEFPNHQISVNHSAVWTSNEEINLYHAKNWGENYRGGTTVIQNNENASAIDYSNPVAVQAIDFQEWLLTELATTNENYVIIKMDIEGAEYPVLRKMIESKTIHLIDELYVEFHHQMNDDISLEEHQLVTQALRSQKHLKFIDWH